MSHRFPTAPAGSDSREGTDACPFLPVFGAPEMMIERGEGSLLWDVGGRRYIDLTAGIAVVSLGHSDRDVQRALCDQAGALVHVSNLFANPATAEAAARLVALLRQCGGRTGQVFFCNSGAEANEAAIKLARRYGGPGRHTVVSAHGSFHGRTLGALAATGQPAKQAPFAPMPEGFRHVPYGDVGALDVAVDESVAAVLLEPIQGENGVVVPPDGYLSAAQALCRERGALFMLDEVQTGCCRTGNWFAFEHEGLSPDVVTLAKGLGNGFPVGVLWAAAEVGAAFRPGDHGSTFSGGALAGAVVSTVLEKLGDLDAPQLARQAGVEFRQAMDGCSAIREIRGRGLLIAVELNEGVDARAVARDLIDRGVLVNALSDSTLRIAPPLTIGTELLLEAALLLRGAIEDRAREIGQ